MAPAAREVSMPMPKQAWGPVVATENRHRLEDGRVQCDVCPRFCVLREGQRGLCFVRARLNDRIVLTTYGRSSGFCVDPIEKKPLNHFLPGTAVLSFGTEGCNLSCLFCQNWDISKSREIATLADEASPELIARAAKRLGCRSVAFTYNDPTIFLEYASDVAAACHELGIATVAVTAGYICERTAGEFLPPHRRGQRGPEGLYGEVLPGDHRRASPASSRHPRLPQETDKRLARDHQPRDPRPQRFRRRDRRDDAVDRREPRARCPAPLHGLSPRLEDAGRPADAAGDAFSMPAGSRSKPASVTPTRATSTTSRAAVPSAMPAPRSSSAATDTS